MGGKGSSAGLLPGSIEAQTCYLGDMLSQEGGCEHAILKRIQTGWLKFRELSGLLIGKGMSMRSKGIIYTTCIRPTPGTDRFGLQDPTRTC